MPLLLSLIDDKEQTQIKRRGGQLDDVLNFIARFTDNGKRKEVIEALTCGCCYWFAQILSVRFDGYIMYDLAENHFVTLIDGRLYDITGDVTEHYLVTPWDEYADEWHKSRIIKQCINF